MLCFVSNLGREPVEDVQFAKSCVIETSSQFTSDSFRGMKLVDMLFIINR
jgi:hypothetical protein